MKKILHLNMGQDDPKTGWRPAAEIALDKGMTHLVFSLGHRKSPSFDMNLAQAVEFSERHRGFTPVLAQHLFAEDFQNAGILMDPSVVEYQLLKCVRGIGQRYETWLDCEPQNEAMRRLKSAQISSSAFLKMISALKPGQFDYATPEICGVERSMYRMYPRMAKVQAAQQLYRTNATPETIQYPIPMTAVIGLAVVPDGVTPPDHEYAMSKAWAAYTDRDRVFYPLIKTKAGYIATLVDVARAIP